MKYLPAVNEEVKQTCALQSEASFCPEGQHLDIAHNLPAASSCSLGLLHEKSNFKCILDIFSLSINLTFSISYYL